MSLCYLWLIIPEWTQQPGTTDSTQIEEQKISLRFPGYMWFTPSDAGECEDGMLWVHPNKSITYGCDNQRVVYRKDNGSSHYCSLRMILTSDWWAYTTHGCMELACLAYGPEKGLELGQRGPHKIIQDEYVHYTIKNGLWPTDSTPLPTYPEGEPEPKTG